MKVVRKTQEKTLLFLIKKYKIDLVVLGISSKGIEWVADQLSRLFKEKEMPKLLILTKRAKYS